MSVRVTSWLSRSSPLRGWLTQARLAWRLLRDPGVPLLLKAIPLLAMAYLVSPLDFVPDIFPIVGQLDDLGVLILATELFVGWCPAPLVDFHRSAIAGRRTYRPGPPSGTADGDVIDAEFRREDTAR